jgi:hypothetical protein
MPGTSPGMTEESGARNNYTLGLWVLAFARTTRVRYRFRSSHTTPFSTIASMSSSE